MSNLKIKGIQKLSVIDYSGKTAAVVFLGGCSFRCPFCQNPELVLFPEKQPSISEKELFSFLKGRKKWLDGVVLTGGEPTMHKGLPGFTQRIKSLGFLVKLDTNGSNPGMLEALLKQKLLDFVSMDVKAPLEKYDRVSGIKVDKEAVKKSVNLIRDSGIDYEFRTTVLPRLHSRRDILSIGKWLKGSRRFFLQQFRNRKTLEPEFRKEKSFRPEELEEFRKMLEPFFDEVGVRA